MGKGKKPEPPQSSSTLKSPAAIGGYVKNRTSEDAVGKKGQMDLFSGKNAFALGGSASSGLAEDAEMGNATMVPSSSETQNDLSNGQTRDSQHGAGLVSNEAPATTATQDEQMAVDEGDSTNAETSTTPRTEPKRGAAAAQKSTPLPQGNQAKQGANPQKQSMLTSWTMKVSAPRDKEQERSAARANGTEPNVVIVDNVPRTWTAMGFMEKFNAARKAAGIASYPTRCSPLQNGGYACTFQTKGDVDGLLNAHLEWPGQDVNRPIEMHKPGERAKWQERADTDRERQVFSFIPQGILMNICEEIRANLFEATKDGKQLEVGPDDAWPKKEIQIRLRQMITTPGVDKVSLIGRGGAVGISFTTCKVARDLLINDALVKPRLSLYKK